MAGVEFTEFRQAGYGHPFLFEEDLVEVSQLVGRPVPELKGSRVYDDPEKIMTWLVVCTMRGSVVAPHTDRNSEKLVVEVLERSWSAAAVRVMQLAMSRLVDHHKSDLVGTRFEHYGMRSAEGYPIPSPYHPQLRRHLQHLEYLVHHTQEEMDRARICADTRLMSLRIVRTDLQNARLSRTQLRIGKKRLELKNRRLRMQLRALRDRVAAQAAQIEELEEEASDL